MTITLDPKLEAFAEQQAHRAGLPDAEAYVRRLLEDQQQATANGENRGADGGVEATDAWHQVQQMRGKLPAHLTSDRLLEEGRSEC
jgi:hypothetical protein